jgi:hypothetical protein
MVQPSRSATHETFQSEESFMPKGGAQKDRTEDRHEAREDADRDERQQLHR